MPTKPYNGHHCWNCWNVSLWIGNDEGLYLLALDSINETKRVADAMGRPYRVTRAARRFLDAVGVTHTPDKARYTLRAVINALSGLE